MRNYLLILAALFAVTGCSSVKSVGQGMVIGSAAANAGIYSAPISVAGTVLSIGADLFSGESISQDEVLARAAAKWSTPHTATPTGALVKLKESSSVDTAEKLTGAIDRAKDEAKTGKFKTKDRYTYIRLMQEYDLGNWINVSYPLENTAEKAIVMWCNKESAQCIISTATERVELPTFRKTSALLKKSLNGASVSFGEFDAYEPGLSKLSCGLFDRVSPPTILTGERTYAGLVKKSLLKEVIDAGGYVQDSAVKISGKLTNIDISIHWPVWNFEMELKSTNGKTLSVKEKYEFKFEFWNNKDKCGQLREALPAAVKDLAEKVAKNPGFAELFRP